MAAVEEMTAVAQATSGSEAAIKQDAAGPGAAANGAAPQASAVANAQPPTQQEIGFAVTFARIVSVLSRSPHYKHYTLSDLEWLVVPAIMTGQCAVMEANVHGRRVPVAVTLWASLSAEVDKRLSETLTSPFRLRPDEWRCGDCVWIPIAEGEAQAVRVLLKQLKTTIFARSDVKMRTSDRDGRPAVSVLDTGCAE